MNEDNINESGVIEHPSIDQGSPQIEEMEVEEKPLSRREMLEKAYDEQVEAPKESSPKEKKRDETGKFIKESAKKIAPSQPPTQAFEPPRSFNDQEKEVFKGLPPEIQQALNRIEDGKYKAYTKKMGEIGTYERKYRDLDDAIAPYEIQWAKAGVTPGQVLRNYLAWEMDFHQNPTQVINQLLEQKGISVQDLIQKSQEISPETKALQQKIQESEGRLGNIDQSRIAEDDNYLDNVIQSFRREVGQDGQPLRPHFDAVYNHMLPIAAAYRQNNPEAPYEAILDAAYKDALYLNPEVREKILDEEFKARESRRLQERSEKVQRARLAGSSLSGTPSGVSMVSTKPLSIRETLEQKWDDLLS